MGVWKADLLLWHGIIWRVRVVKRRPAAVLWTDHKQHMDFTTFTAPCLFICVCARTLNNNIQILFYTHRPKWTGFQPASFLLNVEQRCAAAASPPLWEDWCLHGSRMPRFRRFALCVFSLLEGNAYWKKKKRRRVKRSFTVGGVSNLLYIMWVTSSFLLEWFKNAEHLSSFGDMASYCKKLFFLFCCSVMLYSLDCVLIHVVVPTVWMIRSHVSAMSSLCLWSVYWWTVKCRQVLGQRNDQANLLYNL